MFYRNKKTRKYQAPNAVVTPMVLESNFCATIRFNIQVDELQNMNDPDASEEVLYFES